MKGREGGDEEMVAASASFKMFLSFSSSFFVVVDGDVGETIS